MSEIESHSADSRPYVKDPDARSRSEVAMGRVHRRYAPATVVLKCSTPVWVYGRERMIDLNYQEIVDRRRALKLEPYKSLAAVGFDGPWVTPFQITSKSSKGPVLVALHWLDEPSILTERAILESLGYLPRIRFNSVIDLALLSRGLSRTDIYVTQTFHLIPRTRSERISQAAIRRSFNEVTRFELENRAVIALGAIAASECARCKIDHIAVCHPSRRGHANETNAAEIADAFAQLGY